MRSSPLAVIEWDSEHRVVNWSGNAPHIFGWEASEVLGKRADEWRFVPEEDRETVRVAMEAMDSGRTGTSRNRNYRKDGSPIDCEWYNSVILDRNGGFMGGLSLVLDTTERQAHRRSAAGIRGEFPADLRDGSHRHLSFDGGGPVHYRQCEAGRLVSILVA